jgi:hypothetical protein
MKPFRWNADKNEALRGSRGVTFEQVVVAIESGGLLDVLAHPSQQRYGHQRMLVVAIDGYAYLVPVVEGDDHLFMKTVVPSRKATRDYLGKQGAGDDQEA